MNLDQHIRAARLPIAVTWRDGLWFIFGKRHCATRSREHALKFYCALRGELLAKEVLVS